MHRYVYIIEPTETGFSAFAPDLPGCVTTGTTIEQTASEMCEAIEFHIDGLTLEGMPVPAPFTIAGYADVSA